MVVLYRDVEDGIGVESSKSSQVNIPSENGNPDRELGAYSLESLDQSIAFLLVSPSRVMIVEVVQEIDTTVEVVEETTAKAKSPVHELDGSHDGTTEDILQPCQPLLESQQRYSQVDVLP